MKLENLTIFWFENPTVSQESKILVLASCSDRSANSSVQQRLAVLPFYSKTLPRPATLFSDRLMLGASFRPFPTTRLPGRRAAGARGPGDQRRLVHQRLQHQPEGRLRTHRLAHTREATGPAAKSARLDKITKAYTLGQQRSFNFTFLRR